MKQLVLPPGSRSGDDVTLGGREHHYLARVRRIAEGAQLTALDGDQRLTLVVTQVTPDQTRLRVLAFDAPEETGPRLTLFPFLLKARKLDDVIRQACEAGVSAIVPVEGDHCVSRIDGDGAKKAQRWNTIAKEAAQQSGNRHVCQVHEPISSRDLAGWWTQSGGGPLLVFHQTPLDTGGLHRYLFSRPDSVGLVIGPEGGLSAAEVDHLRAAGGLPIWLGPFVLRAETASLYALAAVNTILQETSEWTIPT